MYDDDASRVECSESPDGYHKWSEDVYTDPSRKECYSITSQCKFCDKKKFYSTPAWTASRPISQTIYVNFAGNKK